MKLSFPVDVHFFGQRHAIRNAKHGVTYSFLRKNTSGEFGGELP